VDVAAGAQALIDADRPVEALPLLAEGLAEAPDDPRLRLLLGVALQRAGRVEEAVAAFERAAELAPDSGLARYNLGAAHFALGNWDAAADAFLAVPERDPGIAPAAWLNAGFSRLKAGRTAEGKALLERAVAADPDGASARAANQVLDALAPAPQRPVPPRAARRVSGAWSVGREYDGNVFALPDDATVTDLSDWRTTLAGEVEARFAVADRYRVTPHYDFDGYRYDTESAYNYRRHRLYLRVDDRKGALRPRLTYGYTFSRLGGEAYVASHWLEGRLTLLRQGRRYVWAQLGAALAEAPGERYDALSGNIWEGTLSAYTPAGTGWVYGAVTARYLDRGSNATTIGGTPVTLDYSYSALAPAVVTSRPLPWRLEGKASLRYEVRRYANPDVWGSPPIGAKRRVDQRATLGLTLARPLRWGIEAELSWRGELRRSNITAADYRDRDYTRNVYGVVLKGEF
jgi:tetratricopeptide (TPR) repeat protein